MLERMRNLGKTDGAVIIRLRPPDLESLGSHSPHPSTVDEPDDDDDTGHGEGECAECPICGGEHEPLEMTPDLEMILSHLVSVLQPHGEGVADEEEDESGDESKSEEDEDVHDDDDGLRLMRL